MSGWNFDMSQAPRDGTRILLADPKAKKVHLSYWLPAKFTGSGKLLEGDRWSGFLRGGAQPIAWMPEPDHPGFGPVADTLPSPEQIPILDDVGSGA